jgi:branched-chain amino acid aminotransferase
VRGHGLERLRGRGRIGADPALSSGCLSGITRALVLEWFAAEERSLPLEVLAEADEVFLTSSTRNVHPVVRADDRHWSQAGPVSSELREAFERNFARNVDP